MRVQGGPYLLTETAGGNLRAGIRFLPSCSSKSRKGVGQDFKEDGSTRSRGRTNAAAASDPTARSNYSANHGSAYLQGERLHVPSCAALFAERSSKIRFQGLPMGDSTMTRPSLQVRIFFSSQLPGKADTAGHHDLVRNRTPPSVSAR